MIKPKGNPGAMFRWLRGVAMILMIVLMVVLHDVADVSGQTGEDRPDRPGDGARVSANEGSGPSESGEDQGKDFVVDEKDLERLYKELLTKKKKEEEKATILKADKDGFYQIYLVNGMILKADTIRLNSRTAIISDDQGMIIYLNRDEIAGIEKIDGKGEGRKEK
jgi:hypothetical protein